MYGSIGSSGSPEIHVHQTVTIVNHDGEAPVFSIATVMCISVVSHYYIYLKVTFFFKLSDSRSRAALIIVPGKFSFGGKISYI